MKRSLLLLLCCSAVVFAQTPEENMVRTTYAKVAYAVQIGQLKATPHLEKAVPADVLRNLAASELAFQISDLKVGDVSEIMHTTYSELVARPNGQDALEVAAGTWDYQETHATGKNRVQSSIADARWSKNQNVDPSAWSMSFGDLIKTAKEQGADDLTQFTRYASYTVTINFKGKTQTYKALALFKGNSMHVLDNVANLNGNAVEYFTTHSAYPNVLVGTHLRDVPSVSEFLKSTQQFQCKAGTGDVCCDSTRMKCGLANQDLQQEMKKPLAMSPQAAAPIGYTITKECPDFDYTIAPPPYDVSDSSGHITGVHNFHASPSGTCSYSGSSGVCNVSTSANPYSAMYDSGVLINPVGCHVVGTGPHHGSASGPSPQTATAVDAGAVASCVACLCSMTVTVSFPPLSVAYSTTSIWSPTNTAVMTCARRALSTPILLTTSRPSFELSAPDTVVDLVGNGLHDTAYSWPVKDSGNAWLVRDRGGAIVPSRDLFGNATEQPECPDDPTESCKNGYRALALFDLPGRGGNNDGLISKADRVFSQLRLWIDQNHNGVAETSELHPLSEFGIVSISLQYRESQAVDQYGNQFRFVSDVNSTKGKVLATDVILGFRFLNKQPEKFIQ